MEVSNLYPQYNVNDRRQQNVYIEKDRRSKPDRRLYIDEKLRSDIKEVKDIFYKIKPAVVNKFNSHPLAKNLIFLGLITTIPSVRRIASVEDNVQQENKTKAFGLGLIGLINVKEDLRDLMSIFGRSKSQATEGYYSKYKFFAGTPVESLLERTKWGQHILYDVDATLADTFIGEKIYSKIKTSHESKYFEKQVKNLFGTKEVLYRPYVKHEGKFFSQLIGLSMNRITKIGLLAMTLLELPIIHKALKNNNDNSQILRSAINVTSCAACGALFSSIFTLLTFNPAASVIGLGLGLFIGDKISKLISSR